MRRILSFICGWLLLIGSMSAQTVVSTAGGLQAALQTQLGGSDWSTVTSLTVTGNIDATDFRFIRDSLRTSLQTLDLSACTIDAYSGMGGTAAPALGTGDVQADYAADTVPVNALLDRHVTGNMFMQTPIEIPMLALTTLKLPISAKAIGNYAIALIPTLTSLNLSDLTNLVSIGDYALEGSGITHVTFPEGLQTLGGWVVQNSANLTFVNFPTSLQSIGGNTPFFNGCSNLDTVYFTEPAQITTFPARFLYSDPSAPTMQLPKLDRFWVPSSVTNVSTAFENFIGKYILCDEHNTVYYSDGTSLWKYGTPDQFVALPKGITSFTIPATMTSIPDNMFQYCSKLTSLTVESQLTSIGARAFQEVPITSFDFPSTLLSIGDYAFNGSGITSVNFTDNANLKTLGTDIFASIPSLTTVNASGLDSMGVQMFRMNANLANVTLSQNLKTVSAGAFSSCTSLTSIAIPSSVMAINNSAFMGCSNLSDVTIPPNLVFLGYSAFASDTLINAFNFPASLATFEIGAYMGNPVAGTYAKITVDDANPYFSSEDGILYNKDKTKVWFIPSSHTPMSIVLPNTVDSIASYAFNSNLQANIKKMTLPASLKWIDSYGLGAVVFSVATYDPVTGIYLGAANFNMDTLVCNAVVPPVCVNSIYSLNNQYAQSGTLLIQIPPNTKSAYSTAIGWKNWYYNTGTDNQDHYQEMSLFTNTGPGMAQEISPNGRYVVGQNANGGFLTDLVNGTTTTLPNSDDAVDVNDNGMVLGTFGANEENGVFRDDKWYSLVCSSGAVASGYAIDADGNAYGMYGGLVTVAPFTWKYNETNDNYITDTLSFSTPCISGDQGGRINDVSSDGKYATGWISRLVYGGMREPINWLGSSTDYKVYENANFSEGGGVSPNGRYIALEVNYRAAVYDTQLDSLIVFGVENSRAKSVSDNGFVVGSYDNNGGRSAFIWSDKLGFMIFRDFLDKYCPGMTMPVDPAYPNIFDFPKGGGIIDQIMGISADGLIIVGWSGYSSVARNGWIIQVPHALDLIDRPHNLTATVDVPSRNKVVLKWDAPADYGTHTLDFYRVYRDGDLVGDMLDATDANATTFTDTNVPSGTHTYTVSALFDYQDSNTYTESGITNDAQAIIIDNYDLPYYDDFEYTQLSNNYWNVETTNSMSAFWGNSYILGPGIGYQVTSAAYLYAYGNMQPYDLSLTSKPFDATGKNTVILSFLFNVASQSALFAGVKDTINVEVGVNGTWTNVYKITINGVYKWTPVSLDISNIAADKLFQVRFHGVSGAPQGNRTAFNFDIDEFGVGLAKTSAPEGVMAVKVNDEPQNRVYYKNSTGSYGLTYFSGALNPDLAVGNSGIPFMIGQRFEAEDMTAFTGKYLTSVSAYLYGDRPDATVPTKISLEVFKNGERIVDTPVSFTGNAWNNFTLPTPVPIDGQSMIIGLNITQSDMNSMPIPMDTVVMDSTFVNSKLLSYDGGKTWSSAAAENYYDPSFGWVGFNGSWAFFGNVRDENVASTPDNDVYAVGYNVYKNGTLAATLHYGQTYIDTLGVASDCYTVSEFNALGGMSDQSAQACVQTLVGIVSAKVSSFNVSPNPASDFVTVDADFTLIKVYDSQGRFIMQTKDKKVDVSGLRGGIYLFDATLTNGKRAVATVIVKK